MKVAFDYQIFLAQKNGGISRFFCNLISELKSQKNIETFLPIFTHENEYLHDFSHIVTPQSSQKFSLNFFKKNLNREITEKFLSSQNFDIFHPTYYDNYFLSNLGNKPFVTTIHDMTYEIFPEFFSPKDQTSKFKIESVKKASKIIAVSHNTKKDLLRLTDIKEEKVVVIPPACSLRIDPAKEYKPLTEKKYLLYVGTRAIYKNFYFMLRSISGLLQDSPNLELICFGAPFDKKEVIFLKNLGLENKVKVLGGNDETLINLYRNALAFIAPSYCEGFYVTLLEAFACGCPTVACNREPIPEVAGDAALYFDPKDNFSIESSVEKIISDANLRNELIAKGYARNKLFSWPDIAAQTRQLYESLL